MTATGSLRQLTLLVGLVSCCWLAGANPITTGPPVVAPETVAQASNVVKESTVAPSAPAPVAEHALPSTVAPLEHATGSHVVPAGLLSTHAPAILPSHAPAMTTLAPHVAAVSSVHPVVTVHSTVLPNIAGAGAPVAHANATHPAKLEACTGFCEYIKPICESLTKVSGKQLFNIQSQFKSFVQKTNGQMSLCFVDHYGLDPTFKAVSHEDLSAICASRNKPDSGKGSFQGFQACASNHWDPELDKELAAIRDSRANAVTHQHPESKTVAANIEHDEEELSMISEVVKKVLGQGGQLDGKNVADVKVIDVTGKTTAAPAFAVPAVAGLPVVNKATTAAPSNKSLLNDPTNTVMVFVDDKTTVAPAKIASVSASAAPANGTVPAVTTLKPVVNPTVSHNDTKVLAHPANATVVSTTPLPIVSSNKMPSVNVTTTTGKPVLNANDTTTVAPATTLKPTDKVNATAAALVASTTKLPVKVVDVTTAAPSGGANSTTAAPTKAVEVVTTTTAAPTKAAATTTMVAATTAKPSLKPIETLEQILKRQEKEKQDLDGKLKAERTKAISQLKKQDNAHTADAKIHQIEHERQMFIDPIGHTIKHQQYEASKQKKVTKE